MLQLNPEELAAYKLLILKDLEKTLKIGYESQYRSILSKIVINKKRFLKKRLPNNISEAIYRYNSLIMSLTKYLLNLFDVFGESAVLNAKRHFEENAMKWGKKLRKKIGGDIELANVNYILKNTYVDFPNIDYIDAVDTEIIWYFSKSGYASLNNEFTKYHPQYYDIKAVWLDSFIKALTPRCTGVLGKKTEDTDSIVTTIQLKEG